MPICLAASFTMAAPDGFEPDAALTPYVPEP
jgi:hypothetical protein